MSGTSMDGIDAALIETDGSENHIQALGAATLDYHPAFKILLKATECAIRQYRGDLIQAEKYFAEVLPRYLSHELQLEATPEKLAELQAYLGLPLTIANVVKHSTHLHIQIVNKLVKQNPHVPVDVIGYHGQTFFHQPLNQISIILGDGQAVADATGITVVNDFRRQDIENGGQGAPFAPLYHFALAKRDAHIPCAIVNCGGLANITYIPSSKMDDILAFDTGPGNGLLDKLVRQRTAGLENMDKDGRYAAKGKVHAEVLKALYAKALPPGFWELLAPKSLDVGDLYLIPELNALSLADACRTLAAFTADSIANCLDLLEVSIPPLWILAGGGWKNPIIIEEFAQRLKQKSPHALHIKTADEIGWDGQALEAQIFAYLAVRSLQGKVLSLPGTTRVKQPMTGGKTYVPNKMRVS